MMSSMTSAGQGIDYVPSLSRWRVQCRYSRRVLGPRQEASLQQANAVACRGLFRARQRPAIPRDIIPSNIFAKSHAATLQLPSELSLILTQWEAWQ